jgi:hypothetical protein
VKRACLLLLVMCGPAQMPPNPPPPDPTLQTAFFKFNTTDQVRQNPNLPRPAIGNVYGSVFYTRDITITGPKDDAGVVFDVTVLNVDVRTGIADAGFVSPQLAPGQYTFLGALDTDDDGGPRPSKGDLATLPTTNAFEIVDGGAQLHKTIVFDLIYN